MMKKWGIQSVWDFFIINLVFALAGMAVVFIRKPLFHLLGITPQTSFWLKAVVYIPIVIPAYQMNLLLFGFLFGKFSFFWEKEKKLIRFLRRPFHRFYQKT